MISGALSLTSLTRILTVAVEESFGVPIDDIAIEYTKYELLMPELYNILVHYITCICTKYVSLFRTEIAVVCGE